MKGIEVRIYVISSDKSFFKMIFVIVTKIKIQRNITSLMKLDQYYVNVRMEEMFYMTISKLCSTIKVLRFVISKKSGKVKLPVRLVLNVTLIKIAMN